MGRAFPNICLIFVVFSLVVGGMGQSDSSAASMMYWTDLANNKIQRANLDGSGIRDLIITGLGNPQFITLDTAAGKMYWTDSGFDMIQRADLNGSNIEPLVTTGLSSPKGIALDLEAGKMYWADSLTHKIQRANLNGNGVEDLVTTGLQWPQGMALDVTAGKMYWTDAGTNKIQRANLDGSDVEDLVNAGPSALQGIALDVSVGKIYWTDLVKIQRANLDGSNIEFLVTTGGRLRGIALDVLARKMYWTDTLWYGKIQCANLDGSGVKDLIVGGMNFPQGLALDVPKPPKIIYVDVDAGGANNGLRWADAYNNLQDALAVAKSGNEIWVAQGIYKPDQGAVLTPGNRKATFQLVNGVVTKGGYAGFGGPNHKARDIDRYKTVLTGDLAGNDVDVQDPLDLLSDPHRAENSYHVVTGSGTDSTTVLDGFTITGGNANGLSYEDADSKGGGMLTDFGGPSIFNCTFSGNSASESGGGMHNYLNFPTLTNCTFIRNAGSIGGGVYNNYAGAAFIDCTFSCNSVNENGGGIQNDYYCIVELTNCIFSGNSANHGGGICNLNWSNVILSNCTFAGNSAMEGCALACDSYEQLPSELLVTNSILWDGGDEIVNKDASTITITYSDVRGGWPGTGNINTDPCFIEPGYWDPCGIWIEGDYHLLTGSPCKNAGDPGYIAQPGETDLDGKPRVIADRIDIGAYEFNHIPVADAGPDQAFETQLPCRVVVILDGSGSSDLDSTPGTNDDVNDFYWYDIDPCDPNADVYLGNGKIMEANLSVGEHIIVLRVFDRAGDFDVDDVNIIVQDTTPPVFTYVPQDLIAECDGSGNWPLLDSWLACAIAVDQCGSVTVFNDFLGLSDGCGATGSAIVTWKAEDEFGNIAASQPATFTIVDTTPPAITCPADVTLECSADISVEETGSATASDTCGSVTITHGDLLQPSCGNAGTLMRTWTATDECGNSSSCVQTITLVDTNSPEFELSVTPAILWPPNHKMVEITPSWTVSDECDPSPDVSLVSIIAREGDVTIGDGHTTDDIRIGEDGSIYLRAWRGGTDIGRIYTITYQVVDDCGNVTVRSATVTVPHDLGFDIAPEH